ncbi:MAG: NAD(P)(+) transhydrogenase (Re/Si-specific) subunit alpha, partial [Prolixibacteraceae bacterium]|nr:NAD(P)(+) transhydrogenase (Re/Si-specific) subunit alpha [Prolixibacteraceae bacterium]
MRIGILKEVPPEKRVAITPETVLGLTKKGITFHVEKGAGESALFSDEMFKSAGAEVAGRKEVIEKSDIIVSVSSLSAGDLKDIPNTKVLVGAFNPFGNAELVSAFTDGKYTAFSLELISRSTRAQSMDILSSMAIVAGYRAVLDAARMLPRFFPMFMSAAGTIKPAKMLILGAGVAGLQALAIA